MWTTSQIWCEGVSASIIMINIWSVFKFSTLQTAGAQHWPDRVSPWCYHAQAEVRRWESHFHTEDVPPRNNRPAATLSGLTQVRQCPPALSKILSVFSTCGNGWLNFLHYRGGGLPGYDIISVYPQCCYDDDRQTLQSCGLTTNTTLLLRMRKRLPITHWLKLIK